MRLVAGPHLRERGTELQQLQGQRPLGVVHHVGGVPCRVDALLGGSTADRTDPRHRVLQVRGGVAGQRQHPVQVEHVVRVVCGGEVRVLHPADADVVGDRGALVLGQVRAQLVDHAAGLGHRFFQQRHQAQGGAGAGAQDLSVLAEHGADLHVGGLNGLRQPARLACGLEDHLEVQLLGGAHHVPDTVGSQGLHPVADRGQIGGGVAVAAVGLADDQWQRLLVTPREALGEHAQSPVGDAGDAGLLEVAAHRLQQVVVGGLPGEVRVGEGHVQLVVDAVEVLLGQSHQALPDLQGLRITGLQGRHTAAGPGGEGVLAGALIAVGGIELLACRLVEGIGVGQQQAGLLRVLAHLQQVLDQHPERGAPVADVVLADHGVAQRLQGAGQGIAHHGGAQVPHVHLFGHVGGGVVQHHGAGGLLGCAQAGVLRQLGGLRGDPVGAQADVQEAGAGDLQRLGHVVQLHGLHDLGGDVARLLAQSLGQAHRSVALEVGELGGADQRVGLGVLGSEGGGEGGLEALGQHDLGSRHGLRVIRC